MAVAYTVHGSYDVANYSDESCWIASGNSPGGTSRASLRSWNTNSNASGSIRADSCSAYSNHSNVSSYKSSSPPPYAVDRPSSGKNSSK